VEVTVGGREGGEVEEKGAKLLCYFNPSISQEWENFFSSGLASHLYVTILKLSD
jgi:hypothetical protein